jgi:hypothetical protein
MIVLVNIHNLYMMMLKFKKKLTKSKELFLNYSENLLLKENSKELLQ